jgi:hypothetical protein
MRIENNGLWQTPNNCREDLCPQVTEINEAMKSNNTKILRRKIDNF